MWTLDSNTKATWQNVVSAELIVNASYSVSGLFIWGDSSIKGLPPKNPSLTSWQGVGPDTFAGLRTLKTLSKGLQTKARSDGSNRVQRTGHMHKVGGRFRGTVQRAEQHWSCSPTEVK